MRSTRTSLYESRSGIIKLMRKRHLIFFTVACLLFTSFLVYLWLTRPATVYKYYGEFGKALGIETEIPEKPEPAPISQDFGLIIPKISLNAPILANVDGTNPKEYMWKVKEGIAHFKHMEYRNVVVDGSFPGEGGNIFLFGHSQIPGGDMSDYQGAFNDLAKLTKGDRVIIYYQAKRFEYQVEEGKVVPKQALEYLEKTPTETLHLMTCWPLGLDVKRYLVVAKPV